MVLIFRQGNRTNYNRIKEHEESEDTMPNSEMDASVSSKFHPNGYQVPTQTMDTTSMNSTQASEYEDAESGAFVIFALHQFLIRKTADVIFFGGCNIDLCLMNVLINIFTSEGGI